MFASVSKGLSFRVRRSRISCSGLPWLCHGPVSTEKSWANMRRSAFTAHTESKEEKTRVSVGLKDTEVVL